MTIVRVHSNLFLETERPARRATTSVGPDIPAIGTADPRPWAPDPVFVDWARRRVLDPVLSSEVGRRLVRAVAKPVVLHHVNCYPGPPPAPAWTDQLDDLDAIPAGVPIRMLAAARPGIGDGYFGTGAGTAARIYMDPTRCDAYAVFSDGVFVHELAHALRMTQGADLPIAMRTYPDARFAYPNLEEYFAQLIMNMYLSELGRTLVLGYEPHGAAFFRRARYIDGRADRAHRAQASGEVEAVTYMIRYCSFFLRDPKTGPFARDLAQISSQRTPYNPFRELDAGAPFTVLVPHQVAPMTPRDMSRR